MEKFKVRVTGTVRREYEVEVEVAGDAELVARQLLIAELSEPGVPEDMTYAESIVCDTVFPDPEPECRPGWTLLMQGKDSRSFVFREDDSETCIFLQQFAQTARGSRYRSQVSVTVGGFKQRTHLPVGDGAAGPEQLAAEEWAMGVCKERLKELMSFLGKFPAQGERYC